MKIWGTFAPWWAASSAGTAQTVWKLYQACVFYLNCSFEVEIVTHLENEHFLADLASVHNIAKGSKILLQLYKKGLSYSNGLSDSTNIKSDWTYKIN